jgi:uncharacterized membrane-anchored protein
MKKIKWIIILVNCLLLLFFFNRSVVHKELVLSNGRLVLLELAPVDPRSLMQGDYMRLRYAIANDIRTDSIAKRGYYIVELSADSIARLVRLQQKISPLNTSEIAIRYNATDWSISIGAESFFFQEGEADKYAEAKYGGLRVSDDGESVLIGLYDEARKLIR